MNKILIDSGAYSAWRLGRQIDLDEYIAFIKRYQSHVHGYFVLDVIPGKRGQAEWRPEKIEEAAQQSYRNHQKMKNAGLSPIPVYHMGDDPKWLQRYLEEDERIVLSHYKKATGYEQAVWFKKCWEIIGNRTVKVHGLGLSNSYFCRRFPWASTDSSTWAMSSGNGSIIVPHHWRGDWDYKRKPRRISVTNSLKGKSDHIDMLRDYGIVERWLHEECGATLEQVRTNPYVRWRVVAIYLVKSIGPMLYFAMGTSPEMGKVLSDAGVESFLLSFFYFRGPKEYMVEDYRNGRFPVKIHRMKVLEGEVELGAKI